MKRYFVKLENGLVLGPIHESDSVVGFGKGPHYICPVNVGLFDRSYLGGIMPMVWSMGGLHINGPRDLAIKFYREIGNEDESGTWKTLR